MASKKFRIELQGWQEGVIVWYKNGQKRSEINYKDGKWDGLWIEWYENGQRSEINHKDGKRDGLWIEWYENFQKRKESMKMEIKLVPGLNGTRTARKWMMAKEL